MTDTKIIQKQLVGMNFDSDIMSTFSEKLFTK